MEPDCTYMRKKELSISISRIALISAFLLVNLLCSKVRYIGASMALIETVLVGLLILKRGVEKAFVVLLVCLSCSLEMSSFVYLNGEGHTLYSIYCVPLMSIFAFYGLTYALFLVSYQKYSKQMHLSLRENRSAKRFFLFLILTFFTGLITGLITILVNDNGIASYDWSSTALFTNSLRILSMMSFFGTAVCLVTGNEGFLRKVESVIVEILFGYGIVFLITIILGWHGYYGAISNIMLMPLAASLCPMLLIIPAFFDVKRPVAYYLAFAAFTLGSMFYNSQMGSKFYFIPLASVFVFVLITMKKRKAKTFFLILLIFLFLLMNSGTIQSLLNGTKYGSWKYNQFINFFNLSEDGLYGWYNTIDDSPRFRIDEFVNIFIEYTKKPWYLVFGKGNAGTILHSWGTTDWYRSGGTFAAYQIESGIFMSMHESINVLFIRHGLVGIVFLITTLVNAIKKYRKSPWCIGAVVWFLFYWGIYISWWIGALMLVLVLCSKEEKDVAYE